MKMIKLLFITVGLFLTVFSAAAGGGAEEEEGFDHAVEQYRNGSFEEAAASFRASSKTRKGEQAVNLYNLGNALVKHAEQLLQTDTEDAASLLEESLEAYQRALEIEEQFPEAGYNMEVAKRLLSKLSEQDEQNQDGPQEDPQQSGPREQEREQSDRPPEQNREQQQKPEMSEETRNLIDEILNHEREEKDILNQLEGSSPGGRNGKNW
jgi:hypothetical protein